MPYNKTHAKNGKSNPVLTKNVQDSLLPSVLPETNAEEALLLEAQHEDGEKLLERPTIIAAEPINGIEHDLSSIDALRKLATGSEQRYVKDINNSNSALIDAVNNGDDSLQVQNQISDALQNKDVAQVMSLLQQNNNLDKVSLLEIYASFNSPVFSESAQKLRALMSKTPVVIKQGDGFQPQHEFRSSPPNAFSALEEIIKEGRHAEGVSLLPRAQIDPLSLLTLQQSSLQSLKSIEKDSMIQKRLTQYNRSHAGTTKSDAGSYAEQPITVEEEEELSSSLQSMKLNPVVEDAEPMMDDSDEEKEDAIGEGMKIGHAKLKQMALRQPLTFKKTIERIKFNPLSEFARGQGLKLTRGRPALMKSLHEWHEKVLMKQEMKKGKGIQPAIKLNKKETPSRATRVALDEGEIAAGNDSAAIKKQLRVLLAEMQRTGELK